MTNKPSVNRRRGNRSLVSPTIVFACDGAYAMQLATTMRSLTESNQSSWPLDIRVLATDIREDVRRQIEQSLPDGSAMIRWLATDVRRFEAFSTAGHISKASTRGF